MRIWKRCLGIFRRNPSLAATEATVAGTLGAVV
jgi:hypothetical protein